MNAVSTPFRSDLPFGILISFLAAFLMVTFDDGGQGLSWFSSLGHLAFFAALFLGMFAGMSLSFFYLRRIPGKLTRISLSSLIGIPVGFGFSLLIMMATGGLYFGLCRILEGVI